MMVNNYKLVKAKLKDFKRAYAIILECSSWLKSKRISRWNPPYPEKLFKRDIFNGNVYLFAKNDELYGTVTLMTKPPSYYPPKLKFSNKSEIYICRLAVPRKFKGNEIRRKILYEIEKLCKSKHIKKMKLDIIKSNKFLKDYYVGVGFTIVENFIPSKSGKKYKPGILMEKEIK